MATMPLGATVRLDGAEKSLEVTEAAVETKRTQEEERSEPLEDPGRDGGAGGGGVRWASRPRPDRRRTPGSAGKDVLRIGWAQDPKTLNPFVGVNEEEYTIWALQWELLLNFDPETLGPSPGIAESWEVSEDKKTITFELIKGAKWSDGEPITSEDVKWSLEVLGGHGLLFSAYTGNVKSIKTPDETTVIIETKVPDARMVGGLWIYILPEHIWGKVPLKDLTGSYQPEVPMVGSGPYIVTEFERSRITRMEVNPEWRGDPPAFEEIQFIRYGSQDAAERALTLGEVDFLPEVEPATFERLGNQEGIETVNAPTYSFTELAFNLCSEEDCPDAVFNPAIQDKTIRQATAYGIDRERNNEIANQGTSFVAHGLLPSFYKAFYEVPELDYPYDPEMANQILDDAGWELNDDGIREKDGEVASFDLYVRSESPCGHPDGEADRRADAWRSGSSTTSRS